MKSRHLIDLDDFSQQDLDTIIKMAKEIRQWPDYYYGACQGKIMSTLFYEPSTRTQMSFQTAMLRLGGRIIGFDNPLNSSVAKGENIKDTIKVMGGYSDIIVMRSPVEGASKAAALFSDRPLINAGDGGHLHPTQTLTDMVTLMGEKGTLSGLCIGLCGDLKHGRTVHSLVKTLCKMGNRFVLISSPQLTLPTYLKELMDNHGCPYQEMDNLEEAMPLLDVLYMTRIQKERFASLEEYESQKNIYILDKPKLAQARQDLAILHPLPRVDEIAIEVDDDPRAKYFEQAAYGVYARMALIIHMLQNDNKRGIPLSDTYEGVSCQNPRCVTQTESYLPKTFARMGQKLVCDFCEHSV